MIGDQSSSGHTDAGGDFGTQRLRDGAAMGTDVSWANDLLDEGRSRVIELGSKGF